VQGLSQRSEQKLSSQERPDRDATHLLFYVGDATAIEKSQEKGIENRIGRASFLGSGQNAGPASRFDTESILWLR